MVVVQYLVSDVTPDIYLTPLYPGYLPYPPCTPDIYLTPVYLVPRIFTLPPFTPDIHPLLPRIFTSYVPRIFTPLIPRIANLSTAAWRRHLLMTRAREAATADPLTPVVIATSTSAEPMFIMTCEGDGFVLQVSDVIIEG